MISALARLGRRSVISVIRQTVVARGGKQLQSVRNGGGQWYYRELNLDVPKRSKYMAEGLMAVMWYWVLYHLYYDYHHIIGHYEYPDPSKWTDEELGIPPDEAD